MITTTADLQDLLSLYVKHPNQPEVHVAMLAMEGRLRREGLDPAVLPVVSADLAMAGFAQIDTDAWVKDVVRLAEAQDDESIERASARLFIAVELVQQLDDLQLALAVTTAPLVELRAGLAKCLKWVETHDCVFIDALPMVRARVQACNLPKLQVESPALYKTLGVLSYIMEDAEAALESGPLS